MNPTLIVITGAGSGIGKALAHYFRDLGFPMILIDRSEQSLLENFSSSPALHLLLGDVKDEATWRSCIRSAQKMHKPISHLIHAAGVLQPGFLTDFELSAIDFHMDVNAKGCMLGSTLIGREMKNQEFGHIITISSLAGLAPVPGLSLYTASKFAVRGFSMAIHQELKDYGVDVSVLCPDLVATPMLDLQLQFPEEAALSFSGSAKVLTVEEVRDAVLKLMKKPQPLLCIPKRRGWLAKIAGNWPFWTDVFRDKLHQKGKNRINAIRKE